MAWASLKGAVDWLAAGIVVPYPGPHGLGLIEGRTVPPHIGDSKNGIPGRMAWASLKVAHGHSREGHDRAGYPGPHGLGLIEGVEDPESRHWIHPGIPGRMAWASLKASAES